MPRSTACTYPYCQDPRDEERDTTLCTEHSERWFRSDDFRKACLDDNVRAIMGLGLESMAMKEIAKFRRKWAKRESDAEAE